jgi:O-methyltransferase
MGAKATGVAEFLQDRAQSAVFHATHARNFRPWRQFKDLTMVPPHVFSDNLDLVRSFRDVPGDIVECGCWRGGMSGAMAVVAPGRQSVLFDSFEGLPDPGDDDGEEAQRWSRDVRHWDNCTADEAAAHEAMVRAGSTGNRVIRGWFDDTVPAWAQEQRSIAVLRLDGDWYDSTMVCLQNLFPLVVPGGVVIIDDYFVWEGCARAVHDYLSTTKAPERIMSTTHRVAYLEKLPR